MIAAWAEAGAPEGDPQKAPPAYEPPSDALSGGGLDLRRANRTRSPEAPISSAASSSIRSSPRPLIISGYTVVPGNMELVHHVIVFIDPHGDSAALA